MKTVFLSASVFLLVLSGCFRNTRYVGSPTDSYPASYPYSSYPLTPVYSDPTYDFFLRQQEQLMEKKNRLIRETNAARRRDLQRQIEQQQRLLREEIERQESRRYQFEEQQRLQEQERNRQRRAQEQSDRRLAERLQRQELESARRASGVSVAPMPWEPSSEHIRRAGVEVMNLRQQIGRNPNRSEMESHICSKLGVTQAQAGEILDKMMLY